MVIPSLAVQYQSVIWLDCASVEPVSRLSFHLPSTLSAYRAFREWTGKHTFERTAASMDVDPPTASSSTSPLTYLEQQETSSPAELKTIWTKLRTAYERK